MKMNTAKISEFFEQIINIISIMIDLVSLKKMHGVSDQLKNDADKKTQKATEGGENAVKEGGKTEPSKPKEERKLKFPYFNRDDEIAFSTLLTSTRLTEAEEKMLDRFLKWMLKSHPYEEENLKIHFATEFVANQVQAEEKLSFLARVGLDIGKKKEDADRFQAMRDYCTARGYTTDNVSKGFFALVHTGVNAFQRMETALNTSATGGQSPLERSRALRRRAEEWRRQGRQTDDNDRNRILR